MPANGAIFNRQLFHVAVPLRHCPPLGLKVAFSSDDRRNPLLNHFEFELFPACKVSKAKAGKKANGAAIFTGKKTMRSWGAIRARLSFVMYAVDHIRD